MRQLIERQVTALKARLKALGEMVPAAGSLSYAEAERNQERRNLSSMLKDAQARLTRVEAKSGPDPRLVKAAEATIRERTDHAEWFAGKLEAEGDYRQARIWRESIPGIPTDVYREMGVAR